MKCVHITSAIVKSKKLVYGNEKSLLDLETLSDILCTGSKLILNCLGRDGRASFQNILYWNFLLETKYCYEITQEMCGIPNMM